MILAGDIGGTKTRLALVDDGGRFVRTETFTSAAFDPSGRFIAVSTTFMEPSWQTV